MEKPQITLTDDQWEFIKAQERKRTEFTAQQAANSSAGIRMFELLCQQEARRSANTRDNIAAQAMQGMLAHPIRYKPRVQDADLHWHRAMAREAFDIATAMLAEAMKRGSQYD